MHLISLHHYPVKSLGGHSLSTSPFSPQGLAHDREWLIATPTGEFITARKLPQMLLWQTEIHADGLTLIAPNGDRYTTHLAHYTETAPVQVWKDQFTAYCGDDGADAWLSERIGQTVRFYHLGQQSHRVLAPDTPLSFADGAPFLLTNTASLAHLNQQLDNPVEMARFRANLVIDGDMPYQEEQWQRIRIGTAEFELFKPCVRCVMTTVDLTTATKHPQQQPLATLAKTRNAILGMNMRTRQSGVLSVGDRVEIIA